MEAAMEAGRQLDALVAEKVLGLGRLPTQVVYFPGDPPSGPVELCPFYSTDIAAAWEVVEHFQKLGVAFEMNTQLGLPRKPYWFVFKGHNPAVGESAPHAICRAALMAVGFSSSEEP